MTIGGDVVMSRQRNGRTAAALGFTSVGLFVIGWAWNHQYVPLLFVAAPIVAAAGLGFAVASLGDCQDRRSGIAAVIGGGLSVLVLLGYVYALLAYTGGGN